MAADVLFLSFELLLWLALGFAAWLAATLTMRPRASLLALLAALVSAPVGGVLPAVLSWDSAAGFCCGLVLALAGALLAAWQTQRRRWPWTATPHRAPGGSCAGL